MLAVATQRACRRGNGGVAASVTMPSGPPPTDTKIYVGGSGGFHRCSPAKCRQGKSDGVAAGGAMPTTPAPTENNNVGRSGACHHRSSVGRR